MRFTILLLILTLQLNAENWPGWRGPHGDGSSAEKAAPVKWSATENIAWKTAIPGEGHSSPVIWGDQIFLITCLISIMDIMHCAFGINNNQSG